MTDNPFRKATKTQAKLRMALAGPSGSGKTYTGLIFATALADGGRVAVIDTERGSSAKYSDLFDFDMVDMREQYPEDTFDPHNYIECIHEAENQGYDVLLIDGLSHEWEGEGGAQEILDKAARRYSGNKWAAWADVTPIHRRFIDTMLQSSLDIIATMRSKTVYSEIVENGKKRIKKLGMGPIQRPGMDYEFDIFAEIDVEHRLYVSKTRFAAIADKEQLKPTAKWFEPIKAWLSEGAPAPERAKYVKAEQQEAPPKAEEPASFVNWPENKRKAFWATTHDLGFDKGLIHAAFGVESMNDYQGTMADAKRTLFILKYGVTERALNIMDVQQALGHPVAECQSTVDAKAVIDAWVEEQAETEELVPDEEIPF